jgi:hypothetical protein
MILNHFLDLNSSFLQIDTFVRIRQTLEFVNSPNLPPKVPDHQILVR